MATVFLVGFDHPDSLRLVDQLRDIKSEYEFLDLSDEALTNHGDAAALVMIWCPDRSIDAAGIVNDHMALGLPLVAIVPPSTNGAGIGQLTDVDFGSAIVEVSFDPSSCEETARRIELVIARTNNPGERNLISHGELIIDQDRYEVLLGGSKIDLTYKEYELLKYIAARPGRVFSRDSLLRAVWDYDYFGGTRTVDVHVRRLRSKINDVRYQFIETVWNVGYRFRSPGDTR